VRVLLELGEAQRWVGPQLAEHELHDGRSLGGPRSLGLLVGIIAFQGGHRRDPLCAERVADQLKGLFQRRAVRRGGALVLLHRADQGVERIEAARHLPRPARSAARPERRDAPRPTRAALARRLRWRPLYLNKKKTRHRKNKGTTVKKTKDRKKRKKKNTNEKKQGKQTEKKQRNKSNEKRNIKLNRNPKN
jgi:hypothetical protein